MLFLEDALRHAECPICLLPLQGGATASQSSDTSASGHATNTTHPLTSFSSISVTRSGDLFSISFAPGVREALNGLEKSPHDHSSGGEDAVVVLKCGHIYHYLCALQLFEHEREKSKCPLCRRAVHAETDLIPFRPQRRVETLSAEPVVVPATHTRRKRQRSSSSSLSPVVSAASSDSSDRNDSVEEVTTATVARHGSTSPHRTRKHRRTRKCSSTPPASLVSSGVDDEDAEMETERSDGVQLVETRQQPPNTIYVQQLLRASDLFKTRATTLHERESDLLLSKKQLEEDCADLETAVAEARRRGELLCPPAGDRNSIEAQATRLAQLRLSCAEMQRSSNRVASEMSAAIHENASLKKEIEKYASKLEPYES